MVDQCADVTKFANAATMPERMDAVRRLMATKVFAKVHGEPAFHSGLKATAEVLKGSGDGIERLLACDLLMRIGSAAPKLRKSVQSLITAGFQTPLPSLELLDGLDLGKEFKAHEARLNIAKALESAPFQWVSEYRYDALACEDRADKVRLELARQCLASSGTVEQMLDELGSRLGRRRPETGSPAETAAGRARDLMTSLTEALRGNRTEATPQVGDAITALARALFEGTGLPKDFKLVEEVARAVLALLDEVLTPRPSLVVTADAYKPLRLVSSWIGSDYRSEAMQRAMAPITAKLREAILLLSSMGRKSASLVDFLVIATGTRKGAAAMLERIAESHPEFDKEVSLWLKNGGRDYKSGDDYAIQRLNSLVSSDVDVTIARLLIDANTAVQEGAREPQKAVIWVSSLATSIKALAVSRGLVLHGEPGTLVDYSPRAHEATAGQAINEPRVRLVTPMVLKTTASGEGEVIARAKVEVPK